MKRFNLSYYWAIFLTLVNLYLNCTPIKRSLPLRVKPKGNMVKTPKISTANSQQELSKVAEAHRKSIYKEAILNTFARQLAQAPQQVDRILAALYPCLSGALRQEVGKRLRIVGKTLPTASTCPQAHCPDCPKIAPTICPACPPVEKCECPKVIAPVCPTCPPPQVIVKPQEPCYVDATQAPESYKELYNAFDGYIAAKNLLQDRYTSFMNTLIASRNTSEGIQHLIQELYSAALEYNQALNRINNSRRAIDHTAQLLQPDNLYTVLVRGVLRSYTMELPV